MPLPVSRRKLLMGSATAVAASLPSVGAAAVDGVTEITSKLDAGLFELDRQFLQALDAHEAARQRLKECEQRFFDLSPAAPKALRGNGPLGRLAPWECWRAAELRQILKDPKRRRVWKKARAALALAGKYEAGVRRAKRESGFAAAEADYSQAVDRLGKVSQSILEAPAHSLAGFAVKARVVKIWGRPEWWEPDEGSADTYERLAAQILDMIIAIVETGSTSNAGPTSRLPSHSCA